MTFNFVSSCSRESRILKLKKAILRLNFCSFLVNIYYSILSYMINYCNEICGFIKSSGRYAMFYDQVSGCGGESTPNQAAA
jgi:hypothetical protein